MDELVEIRHMHEIEQLKKLSIRAIPIQYDNMHTQFKKTSWMNITGFTYRTSKADDSPGNF